RWRKMRITLSAPKNYVGQEKQKQDYEWNDKDGIDEDMRKMWNRHFLAFSVLFGLQIWCFSDILRTALHYEWIGFDFLILFGKMVLSVAILVLIVDCASGCCGMAFLHEKEPPCSLFTIFVIVVFMVFTIPPLNFLIFDVSVAIPLTVSTSELCWVIAAVFIPFVQFARLSMLLADFIFLFPRRKTLQMRPTTLA
ncbi:hypothetical protein PFISCL1PPCAC_2838, partial [Pristionchus fissidentatus]